MSNPSRFDKKTLLDGNAGHFFNECLYPITNRFCCDIRLIDEPAPLLPNTKVILLLGQRAHSTYTGLNTTVDEHRGNPIVVNNIVCISTFLPQDCMDIKDHESRLNPELVEEEDEFSSDETQAGELIESKGRGKTARSNYRFWVKFDISKALKILENNGQLPKLYEGTPVYHIYPNSDVVVDKLSRTKDDTLYFDMETDFISIDMRCFAFCFGKDPFNIYVVPTLTIEYKPAYDNLVFIIRALIVAIRDNVLVAHNGAGFDFLVLAYKYQIPIFKVYDTMVAQQRIFPDVEKSLGHAVSYYTYEPYHKNEGVHGYSNLTQADQLYLYCGKDVFTMYLVHKGQIALMEKDSGLRNCINQAMRLIKPYLTMSLLGMKFDEEERQRRIKENDRLMLQYLRIMEILCGKNVEPLISNKKCTEYFHNLLGYPSVKKTPKGGNSLAADALLKLRLRHDNPVIDFLLRYREVQKETGILNFKVWQPSVNLP